MAVWRARDSSVSPPPTHGVSRRALALPRRRWWSRWWRRCPHDGQQLDAARGRTGWFWWRRWSLVGALWRLASSVGRLETSCLAAERPAERPYFTLRAPWTRVNNPSCPVCPRSALGERDPFLLRRGGLIPFAGTLAVALGHGTHGVGAKPALDVCRVATVPTALTPRKPLRRLGKAAPPSPQRVV